MLGGRFTALPEIGFGLSDIGREFSLGWRLVRVRSGTERLSLELELEGRRRESHLPDRAPEHEANIRLRGRW